MSRRLIGTLTDPSGTPLAGWTLIIDARRNSAPTVPLGSRESVVLGVSGGYDLIIGDGLYMALITAPGDTVQRRLGLFLIAPGTDIDILTLIGLYTPAGSLGTVGLSLAVADEGTQLTGSATSLNFTGAGATATAVGGAVTIDVPGGGGGSAVSYSFAYGDATPAPLLVGAANKAIYSVILHILEAFNGVGASLTVGDAGQPDRLMLANQNNPAAPASYAATPDYVYGSNTQLLLSITPGAGATQGRGLLTIEVQL